jgi:hypothetical protein
MTNKVRSEGVKKRVGGCQNIISPAFFGFRRPLLGVPERGGLAFELE